VTDFTPNTCSTPFVRRFRPFVIDRSRSQVAMS